MIRYVIFIYFEKYILIYEIYKNLICVFIENIGIFRKFNLNFFN